MINFKNEVAKSICNVAPNLELEKIENLIEIPPNYNMGDYAFPCFILAKEFKKAPNLIAEELVKEIQGGEYFKEIKNVGPYINFFVNTEKLAETVLESVVEEKENFGSTNIGDRKSVV